MDLDTNIGYIQLQTPTTPPEVLPSEGAMVGFVAAVSHPFKDTRGRYRTKSLFKEWETPAYPAYYNLGPEDEGKYASLRKRYLEIADPTEYEFALLTLGGWDHHKAMLATCQWYREFLELWRAELEIKMRGEGIREMKALLLSKKEPIKLAAAKYLAEAGWKEVKTAPKRGRPSKVEVQGELQRQARDAELLSDDAQRIGVN